MTCRVMTCGQVRDIAMMHSEHTLQRVLIPDSTKPNRQTVKEEDLKVWHADKMEACAGAAGSGSASSQRPAHSQESSRGEGKRRWEEGKRRWGEGKLRRA